MCENEYSNSNRRYTGIFLKYLKTTHYYISSQVNLLQRP